MKVAVFAACALALVGVSANRANASTVTFDWTLSGPAASLGGVPLPGSGTITATVGTNGDTVTGITGTIGGSTITGLTTADGSDNLIFPSGTAPLDTKGLAFTAGGETIDIFSFFAEGSPPSGNAFGEIVFGSSSGFGVGTFSLSPAVSATPLPPTWTMMLSGLLGLALVLYRKEKRGTALRVA
jgi:hypothetical protein